jgi:hypothetical protein
MLYKQEKNPMAKPTDDDDELDFELVTSARMLAPPPPLRKEAVTLKEWKTTSGKAARLLVWELTGADYGEFVESGWTYKDGVRKKYDNKDEDIRFLAFTIRDQHGNRLWHTTDAAKGQLGHLGKGTLNLLLNAANKVNTPPEAVTEGNSDETQTDS